MNYEWKPFSNIQVSAQVVGDRLQGIADDNEGQLLASAVVDDARPESAPLHPCFEWDDNQAAGLYREDQARYIIRKVVAVYEEAGKEPGTTVVHVARAFVHVEEGDSKHYTGIVRAMSDDALREQVLTRAMKEVEDWRKRYAELVELSEIFAAIETMNRKPKKRTRKTKRSQQPVRV